MSSTSAADQGQGLSLPQAARVAGFSLLVMSVLSPLAFFGVFPRLIVRGNLELTMQNLVVHRGLFLTGIGCYLLTFVADVLVAWALYVLMRPVNPAASLLAAWFRLVYTVLALVALFNLVTALRVANAPDYLTAFGPAPLRAQVQLLLGSFRYEWGVAMIFFALHLGVLGVLVYRSGYVPAVLGVLLLINAAGYLVDNLRPYLFPEVSVPYLFVAFFGELILMLWLLARGARIEVPPRAPSHP
jgi:Domain of unknown function (DUF4386)